MFSVVAPPPAGVGGAEMEDSTETIFGLFCGVVAVASSRD